jgi:Pentapeptide repeats (8 copies)
MMRGKPVTALPDIDLSEIPAEKRRLAGPAVACVATAILLAATVVVGVSLARTPQADGLPAALTKLSSTSLDTRLGGIGDLQEIMSASPSDQPAVVRALSAFIRHRSPAGKSDGPITPDIQAALNALSSRNISYDDGARIDLAGANLTNANLSGINLSDADLSKADLTGADLSTDLAM